MPASRRRSRILTCNATQPERRSSCACRLVPWPGTRGRRRSVRTWHILGDGEEPAERLGIESGRHSDPAAIPEDQFKSRLGGAERGARIGENGHGQERGGVNERKWFVLTCRLGGAASVEALAKRVD